MRILSIETSCDETAIAIVEAEGDERAASFHVLGNALLSQVDLHKNYGGVFPALAKREHAKNLVPLLEAALEEAEILHEDTQALPEDTRTEIAALLAREPGLAEAFFAFIGECEPPQLDAIAVTQGPGLEPALWVGINFAQALSRVWNVPLVGINHMEGHILAALAEQDASQGLSIRSVELPLVALLISGGHTELVLAREWLSYELLGQTRDDAVGEAFDKVARMLGLPYPGGPEISKLAEEARAAGVPAHFTLPRPMLHDGTYDFSFAGLKTAVMHLLKKQPELTTDEQRAVAREFEAAAAEVLVKKTLSALEETGARTLVLGGGVSANAHIRRSFADAVTREAGTKLCLPAPVLTTDNAIMIALAGFYRASRGEFSSSLIASGNLSLSGK